MCKLFTLSFTLIIRGRQSKELSINIWLCDMITRIHAKICHVHMLCVRLLDLVLGYVNKAASVAADWFYHHAHYTSVTQTRFYPVIGWVQQNKAGLAWLCPYIGLRDSQSYCQQKWLFKPFQDCVFLDLEHKQVTVWLSGCIMLVCKLVLIISICPAQEAFFARFLFHFFMKSTQKI